MLTGLIRVSFDNNADANNAARYALTGTISATAAEAPFKKPGTQMFICRDADEVEVAVAIEKLAKVVADHAATLDFINISMMRQP